MIIKLNNTGKNTLSYFIYELLASCFLLYIWLGFDGDGVVLGKKRLLLKMMLLVPSVVANILKPLILSYMGLLLKTVSEHLLFCVLILFHH